MRYLLNRYLGFTFVILPLIIIIAVFINFPIHNEKSETDIPIQNVSNRYNPYNPEEFFDNFKIETISIERRENNRVLFTLSADKVIHRKRISRIFVYQNLKEIFMAGGKIDFYPYYKNQIKQYENIAITVADIVNSFTSLGKPPTSREDYLSGN